MSRPENVNSWNEWDSDNFKFIIHELFLYAIAILTKHEKFREVNILLTQQYYLAERTDYGKDAMIGYEVFREYLRSLEHRNNRLELRRLSIHADLLEQRSKASGIEFRYLMQADFILFCEIVYSKLMLIPVGFQTLYCMFVVFIVHLKFSQGLHQSHTLKRLNMF
ncbi:hypothetical protein ACLEEB_14270 [Lonsdalea quercina]|uniref:hypothetical protein n=1 Tax=Lonsdalea quercina TaxID=71657 RepID=UPI00397499A9